jgi:large conductance mechanosensitive channel
MFQNLRSFLLRGNIIDLAIGVIIGTAFSKIISALVDKLLMPFIGIVLGGVNFNNLQIKFGEAILGYGSVIQAIIDFMLIGFTLYVLLKIAGQNPGPPELTTSEKLLQDILDEMKKNKS